MKVKDVDVGAIVPYERNAKKHPKEQIRQIAESIQQFGFQQPLVLDRDNVIIIGHGRLEAAKKLGMETVPCVHADELSEEEVKKLRLLDNKLNESEWDFDLLKDELEGLDFGDLDIDWGVDLDLDFDFDPLDDFNKGIRAAKERGERGEEYNEFEEKFKPKLTTDDCFTPPRVYEAVKEWAVKEYGWEGRKIIRPFYPGGDYEKETYPKNCVVIDNPPFSIFSKIVKFYDFKGIDYFLFGPHLTLFSGSRECSYVVTGVGVVYENGANVNTSFVCSKGPVLRTAPDLYRIIHDVVQEMQREKSPELPNYEYPANLITSTKLSQWSKYGIRYSEDNVYFTRCLDAQKEMGSSIYGAGFIVPAAQASAAQAAAAQAAAAQAAAAQAAAAQKWEFSDREKEIVRDLERKSERKEAKKQN